jgi:sugar/nucleoside kinase (ribokinase family)
MKRVIGIGNALVDIMVRLKDDSLLTRFSLPAGSMQLVDGPLSVEIKAATKGIERSVSAGGSVANTIHALGLLGASPGYIGSVGRDVTGEFFAAELRSAGVDPVLFLRESDTGTAVALVTPDSERTFATHLGAAVELNAGELNAELFKGYDILYLEGYLVINYALTLKACQLAKSMGMLVAIDLSSYNVVEGFRKQFEEIVTDYVDICFANEEEAKALTGLDAEAAAGMISKSCSVVVVKTGSKGSIIRSGNEVIHVPTIPVAPLDTTGAGDMYAAGFLYGYCNDEPLLDCGQYGTLLAGNVIEVMGAKLTVERWQSLRDRIVKTLREDLQ